MSLAGYFVGQAAGWSFVRSSSGGAASVHSLPAYHGAFVAVWVGVPALVLVLLWLLLQGSIVDRLILISLPSSITEGADASRLSLYLSEIKNLAAGRSFGEVGPEIVEAADRYARWQQIADWSLLVVAIAVMLVGLLIARTRLAPRFRARNDVEKVMTGVMFACAAAAIVTTIGIIVSLLFEALRFFALVPPHEFFFGLRWEPQIPLRADQIAGAGAFGAVPVFWGTLVIAVTAMIVATPIGLFTAIYLVEYADDRIRKVVKPILEILAGIPTVVYGFFAVLTVAPAVRQAGLSMGLATSPNSVLAAGGVMGIMIIPFISSISDDALRAVPRAMRDGSLAMGATRAETMKRILLPAALPGIMGGILLGFSRAIGETMIVVMAAGLIATLTINPLNGVTTVTVQIVTLLIGDTEFDSPKTLAAFALGLVLFVVTLGLNVVALSTVRKYREKYE
jgi:phosphate transport system permease protein